MIISLIFPISLNFSFKKYTNWLRYILTYAIEYNLLKCIFESLLNWLSSVFDEISSKNSINCSNILNELSKTIPVRFFIFSFLLSLKYLVYKLWSVLSSNSGIWSKYILILSSKIFRITSSKNSSLVLFIFLNDKDFSFFI